MSNTYKTGLAAAIAASMALVALALPCPNQGFVQGTSPCAAVNFCSNHSSQGTCTTAYQVLAFVQNTGTVQGAYINKFSAPCYQTVTCSWTGSSCQIKAGSGGGDYHNALFNAEAACGT